MGSFHALFWAGRILFGMLFVMSGFNHFTQVANMTRFAESKGVPMARFSVLLSGLALLLGGLSIIFWWWVEIGAWLIALFLLAAAFKMHDFWTVEDPMEQQNQMAQFMKNIALAGAAIIFYALVQAPALLAP
ncbi:MAG: DoxX family membrane protein [Gemmatimonadota bacterium]